ncbi:hypothetical protein VRK_42090 [Vibrio sp. MEBiC08052]|nr:hypothetical protein VRK_42090 [Vibrio sp. MEBiC08052]
MIYPWVDSVSRFFIGIKLFSSGKMHRFSIYPLAVFCLQ